MYLVDNEFFCQLQMYPSHYRKRLAVDERHTSRTDDSHMFIIKLPPNPHYYVSNYVHSEAKMPKVPVGFQSNGKPKKIYHWNIPVLKKMKTSSRLNLAANSRQRSDNSDNAIEKIPITKIYHKTPSYYSPVKDTFHKYFPGNGKPKSFYIIDKNKKTHKHKILA